MSTPTTPVRAGALALAFAGALFVLYPATRPWHDESTVPGAVEAMTAGAWVASHTFAMLGFILVALGLLVLAQVLAPTPGARAARAAVVLTWVGTGLTLPYYGAETFGLQAIAGGVGTGVAEAQVLELVDAVRYEPVAVSMFALGLLGLAVGAVLAAVAIVRARVLPTYSGVVFALGYVLFLPQFFTPAPVRIGHGVLLGAGLLGLAWALWRYRTGVADRN